MDYDLVVIGGGPAGMMAAATAAKEGLKVLLIDKNDKLGKKLYITGKGRCNVTNYGDLDDFISSITTNKKFLYSAFNNFNNYQLIGLLNNDFGVKTKVERGNRVFPESDKSSDIIKGFQRYLDKLNVTIMLDTEVKKIVAKNNKIKGVLLKNKAVDCKSVLIATGGMSYKHTGSTGDGYRMAKELGHQIIEPKPALIPLVIAEEWLKDLQGLALKNINVTLNVAGKDITTQFGEMLFTHFGVSGPIILTISSIMKDTKGSNQKLYLDLKPALTIEQLDKRIQRDFSKYTNKQVQNALDDLLPKKLVPIITKIAGLEDKVVNQISKQERQNLVTALKRLELTITGTRPINEAIITSGGVKTNEINPSTMESKLVKGLYFAGEVIDVDAVTGGYNLQIAFSTGYLSGASAAKK